MLTMVGLVVLAAAGAVAVKLYERHLNAQVGPWITELDPHKRGPRLVRQRIEDRNR